MAKQHKIIKSERIETVNPDNLFIEKSFWKGFAFKEWMLYVGIFIFTFILYSNTFHHQWALDDGVVFKENSFVKQGTDGFGKIMTTHSMAGIKLKPETYQYRPLSLLMFAVEWQLSPDSPGLYHVINVIWYALACVLLFIVLRKLFAGKSKILPLVVTILYAAHPMHTEAVANIKGRDEIIFLFFMLSAIWFTFQYMDKKKFPYVLGVFASFLFGMFSKESAITFLAGIPLTMYFFSKAKAKDYLYIMSAIALPVVIYLLARFAVLSDFPSSHLTVMQNYFAEESLMTRWACAIMLLGKYLLLMIFPYQQVCDYSYNQLPLVGFGSWQTLLSLAVYMALVVYAVKGFVKKNRIAYGIFFFIVTMSVYSNLVLIIGSSFADRFLFVPSLGYCIAIGYLLYTFSNLDNENGWSTHIKQRLVSLTILSVILLFFTIKTFTRSAEWENNFTLYGADIKKSPNSARLNFFWGEALRDKAIEYQAKNATPSTPTAMENNNLMYRTYLFKSILAVQKGLEIYPRHANAYDRLGYAYYSLSPYYSKEGFLDSAEKYYGQALSLNPNSLITNYNIAETYYVKGKYEEAKNHYYTVVVNDPSDYVVYFKLGSTYSMLGKMDSAVLYLNTYMKQYPAEAVSCYNNLAIGYARLYKLDSAIAMCDKTIGVDPYNVSAFQMKIQLQTYLKQYPQALATADALIAITSEQSAGYMEKANVFGQMNRKDSANFYYQLAKSKNNM